MDAFTPVVLAACPEDDLAGILRDRRGPALHALAGAEYGVYVRSGSLIPGFGGSFLLRFQPASPGPLGSLDATLVRAQQNGPAGPWAPFQAAGCALPSAAFTLRTVDPADRDNRYARALSARTRPGRTSFLDPLQVIRAYVVEAAPGNPTVLLARVVLALGPWRPLAAWAVLTRL
jgi:hypothetical protein